MPRGATMPPGNLRLVRKLTKLRQNPRLFVYDFVASRVGRRRGPATWLLGRMVDALADAVVTLATEHATIAPLRQRLSERIGQCTVSEMSRAGHRALERLDSERKGVLFVALTLALAEHDREAAMSFGEAHIDAVGGATARSLVIAARDSGAYTVGTRFLENLPAGDERAGLELTLARLRLEGVCREAISSALEREDMVVDLTERLLAGEARLPAEDVANGDARFLGRLLGLIAPGPTASRAADEHLRQGSISGALRALEGRDDPDDAQLTERIERLRSLQRLREGGFDYRPAEPEQPFAGLPGQVLVAVHHDASHRLLAAINHRGWNAIAVTPMEVPAMTGDQVPPRSQVIDGVEHLRIYGRGLREAPLDDYLAEYADRLQHLAKKREPEIIHARSNALVGLVAGRVARSLRIPFVYEVGASPRAGVVDSEYRELLRQMELSTVREADAVVCPTEDQAEALVDGGVDREAIAIAGDEVDMADRHVSLYRRLSPYRLRPDVIDLSEIELAPAVVEIREAYRSRDDSRPLRDDDYARLSQVLAFLDPGASILDVGVGSGQFLNIVGRAGAFSHRRGVDVDRHPSFFTLDEPFDVDYLSAESLPYDDGAFDVVTCLEVIEHLDDAIFSQSLAELRRVCSRQLIITVPFRERVLAADHKRRFDIDDLERLFPGASVTLMRKIGTQLGLPAYWALIEERPLEPRDAI